MHTYEVLVEPIGTSPCDRCPVSCPWRFGDPKFVTIDSSFRPLEKNEMFPPKPVGRQNARVVANRVYKRVDTLIGRFKRITGLTMTRSDALHMATKEEFRLRCEKIPGHLGCIFSGKSMPIEQNQMCKS